jgi:hypothetical protein
MFLESRTWQVLTTLPPFVRRLSRQCGTFNISQPIGLHGLLRRYISCSTSTAKNERNQEKLTHSPASWKVANCNVVRPSIIVTGHFSKDVPLHRQECHKFIKMIDAFLTSFHKDFGWKFLKITTKTSTAIHNNRLTSSLSTSLDTNSMELSTPREIPSCLDTG